MKKGVKFSLQNGKTLKIGIIYSRWNIFFVESLLTNCLKALKECKVEKDNIFITQVPGSYELPWGAKKMIKQKNIDAVICLGCLIKGETMHFEYIAEAVSQGIMKLNLETGVPVVFGVLTCLTKKQAKERASGKLNSGREWGMAAVEMALLSKQK